MNDSGFLGRGWGFPPAFSGGGRRARMAEAESDIRESLFVLLSTSPGERIMQPDYGCGLRDMVWENFDSSTVTDLVDRVERAILFFEPRIVVDEVAVDLSREDEGILSIDVHYRIRGTNNRSNMVYPFYFLEGTNL